MFHKLSLKSSATLIVRKRKAGRKEGARGIGAQSMLIGLEMNAAISQ
jgi:hypothetical protein